MVNESSGFRRGVERCVEVLRLHPSGLFSDFDGTLSQAAPTPDGAVIADGARSAFERISSHVDVSGIITGRAIDDVMSKVGLDDLVYVGNHGLEWNVRGTRHDHEAGTAAVAALTIAMADLERELARQVDTSGVIWEDKRLSTSIHYRNAPDPMAVEQALLPLVERETAAQGLRFTRGRMVVELRPKAIVSKGTALETLVREHNLRGVVFLGDDVTDVDGFRAMAAMSQHGELETVAIGVRSPEVHPDVLEHSDIVMDNVAETVRFLTEVAAGLDAPVAQERVP